MLLLWVFRQLLRLLLVCLMLFRHLVGWLFMWLLCCYWPGQLLRELLACLGRSKCLLRQHLGLLLLLRNLLSGLLRQLLTCHLLRQLLGQLLACMLLCGCLMSGPINRLLSRDLPGQLLRLLLTDHLLRQLLFVCMLLWRYLLSGLHNLRDLIGQLLRTLLNYHLYVIHLLSRPLGLLLD